jgi:hypothetical protein
LRNLRKSAVFAQFESHRREAGKQMGSQGKGFSHVACHIPGSLLVATARSLRGGRGGVTIPGDLASGGPGGKIGVGSLAPLSPSLFFIFSFQPEGSHHENRPNASTAGHPIEIDQAVFRAGARRAAAGTSDGAIFQRGCRACRPHRVEPGRYRPQTDAQLTDG